MRYPAAEKLEIIRLVERSHLPVRRTAGFREACPDGKVRCRFLSGDLRQIWVHMPHRHEYLKVPVNPQWRDYAEGLSLWQHVQILKFERDDVKGAFDPEALNEAKGRIADKFEEASPGGAS